MATDTLRLLNIVFQARHGCTVAERELGATFRVSVEVRFDARPSARSDRIEETVDVRQVCDRVAKVMTGRVCNLVETVAENIAASLLNLDRVEQVSVIVHKDRAVLPFPSDGYEIRIERP